MKRTLASILSTYECEELRKYFRITEEELSKRGVGDGDKSKKLIEKEKKMECLLTIIEEKGHLSRYNINNLTDAVSSLGNEMHVSNLKGPIEGYELHGIFFRFNLKYYDLKAKMSASQKAWEDERNQLITKVEAGNSKAEEQEKTLDDLQGELVRVKKYFDLAKIESTNKIETLTAELNVTKQKLVTRIKELGTANKDLEETKQVLQETKQDRDITRTELKQYQLDFAKESKALKEVLNQTKEVMAELHSKRAVEDKPLVDSEETRDDGVSILAAEFGRLIVEIADRLTLDQSLQLAMLFNLPLSVSDALCRVSLFQSPGMKFLEEIRNRNIINMYDVTNLQKAFAVLKLENIKQNLLEPYQDSVEDELHELHRAEEMLTWEDVEALNAKSDKTAVFQLQDSKIPPQKGVVEGLDESSQAEAKTQNSETRMKDSVPSQRGRHQQPAYIEYNIGREGGIMHLAGASLTIPSDAIFESHVIGFTVTNKIPFPLPREVDNARMTPLIKLEPLGLMFKKPLQLTIPHSALIPEPEKHNVIIFSGQMSTKTDKFSGSITWTEDRSLSRQLKEKAVTLNIQCLSYLSASLMSQSSEPSFYIVRAVPFVDGVRNDDDDIILTVCFCGDNESEYRMLLSDYQTKLPLEQYSTLHLRRHSRIDDKDKAEFSVKISSPNNSYMPDMRQELVKDIAVSHLFAASRISHQFRLKKNQQIESDFVDLVLTISQAGNKLTEIFLKTRIKDLMISQKSADLLGTVPPAVKPYEDLKSNISSMLEKLHCRQLATYFELSPSETERVENNAAPGRMLIKILDEREKIMPQKMIDLFHGLKACHLDKIARLVSEYIDLNSKQTRETQKREIEKNSTGIQDDVLTLYSPLNKRKTAALNNQSAKTNVSSNQGVSDAGVKALAKRGRSEQVRSSDLDISKGRSLARTFTKNQHVNHPERDAFLSKEQYIDSNGGEIILQETNVRLFIPPGAVPKRSIASLKIMTSKYISFPGKGPQLTQVIKCGPESLSLKEPAILKIPHCAADREGVISTEVYFGFSTQGDDIFWKKSKVDESSSTLEIDHLLKLPLNNFVLLVWMSM